MPSIEDVFPRNVAAERARRRMKQKELAELIGWSTTKISEFESGSQAPRLSHLALFCRAFDVPLEDLLHGADPEEVQALRITSQS